MKIHEQQMVALSQVTAQPKDGLFAGRAMQVVPMASAPQPLSALLRGSIRLDQAQEMALQRLQQGEHLSLSERRIRVV